MPQHSETPASLVLRAVHDAIATSPSAALPMHDAERKSHACRLLLTALIDVRPEYHEALGYLLDAERTLDDAELATAYDGAATELASLSREADGRLEAAQMNSFEERQWAAWEAASKASHAGLVR